MFDINKGGIERFESYVVKANEMADEIVRLLNENDRLRNVINTLAENLRKAKGAKP